MTRNRCWMSAGALLGAVSLAATALGQTTASTGGSQASLSAASPSAYSLGTQGKATGGSGGVVTGQCAACPPGGTAEVEPNCGIPEDVVNGGCNSIPPVFGSISCGETICGTSEFNGATRDTDWYAVTVNSQTRLTFTAIADFDLLIGIVSNNGIPDCAGVSAFLVASVAAPCTETSVSFCVPAGTWWIFVGPQFTTAFPCGGQYHGTLECVSCEPPPKCDVVCEDTEGEPNCGLPEDVVNGGCNSIPPVFSPIACGDVVCGSGAFNGATRDTDWFSITLAQETELTWTAVAEFDLLVGIVENRGIDDCAGVTAFRVFATSAPCVEASVTSCLPAGTWWCFVAPQFIGNIPCGAQYQAELTCGPCGGGCDVTCPPGATDEPEACGEDTNGGCNSVPPVFTNIQNGDTFCGTAWADANTRDTDWYRLVLASESEVEFCVATQFDGLIGIVENNGIDNCNGVSAFRLFAFTADDCNAVCVTTTLPAGTWWFFVGTSAFSGTPCNTGRNDYTATLTVAGDDPCNFKGCYADFDGNGTVNSADVGAFLTAYFACLQNQPPADECVDCDRNGTCNSADVGCFLTIYFQQLGPCAP